jgi:inosose dehydratase
MSTTDDLSTVTEQPGKPSLPNLRLGTAPDSWGVWFPDDPKQVPWHQFLDEAAEAGYTAVELGPFGYLPTNPEQLRDELGRRGLTLTAATPRSTPRSSSAARSLRCSPPWTPRT